MPVAGARLGTYDDYAVQRVVQKIDALVRSHKHLSLGGIAAAISEKRNIEFHREYMTRLRKYELTDPLTDLVIDWIVDNHDPKFRDKLSPDSIFTQVGESSFDFYFHLAQMEDYDSWEEEVLKTFEGVYLCAPAQDRHSYLPMTMVREFFENSAAYEKQDRLKRSPDIKQYIAERSIVILRATRMGYYHAAEFPLSLLFPPDFVTLDVRQVYEGIGIASGNSIHLFLRECLSRTGKLHSILITANGMNEAANPHDIPLFTVGEVRHFVRQEWQGMTARDLAHMKQEFAQAFNLGFHLEGQAQVNLSPVPDVKNRVVMIYPRENVFHRKPADFLRHPDLHLILPDLKNAAEIERVIQNPLAVGSLL
jgi:hypothetical protein